MGWAAIKVFSIVMFLGVMVVVFIWMAAAASDLAVFFGFRTSHTIANDLANRITSISSVPGEASVSYSIFSGAASQNRAEYDILIGDKLVCVTSVLGPSGAETIDCASHPYELAEDRREGVTEGCYTFRKLPSSLEEPEPRMEVSFRQSPCGGTAVGV